MHHFDTSSLFLLYQFLLISILQVKLSTEVIVHDRRLFYAEAIQHGDNSF